MQQVDPRLIRLGEAVKAARHSIGWSKETLAHKIGCSRQTIISVESARTQLQVRILLALIDALLLDLTQIF